MIDASFKILVEGQALTIQSETLKIRDDENSFQDGFKAPHSNNPFLLIRNDLTSKLLKTDSIQTVGKKRTLDCQVQRDNIIYPGRLTILDVFTNTIKCDITFYSAIFPILSNKINTYMPVISVLDDPTPDPYVAESPTDIDDSVWDAFSIANKYNAWPSKDFCLPWIEQADRFGEDLSEGDEWFYYVGTLNRYFVSTGEIVRNLFADGDFDADPETPDTREFFNRNVVVPCVFLLSPIYHALQSVGYKMAGSFIEDPKVQKTIMIPKEDQMTAIINIGDPIVSSYDGLPFIPSVTINFSPYFVNPGTLTNKAVAISFPIDSLGSIEVTALINVSNLGPNPDSNFTNSVCYINIKQGNEAIFVASYAPNDQSIIEFTYTVNPTPEDLGEILYVYYVDFSGADPSELPQSSTVTIEQEAFSNSIYRIHPTLELGRFTPDITVANYINDFLKNWHNLRITIDDVKQIVYFDYNESFVQDGSAPVVLENLYASPYAPNEYDSFTLAYAGEDAESIFIDSTGIIEDGIITDSTKELELKVKPASYNGTTASITTNFLNDTGTVVTMFDASSGIPYTIDTVNSKKLDLAGIGGMYDTNFKTWYRFRINASAQTVVAAYSSIKLEEIKERGKVYFNQQLYMVSSIQYTEKAHVKEVTIDLESVNF